LKFKKTSVGKKALRHAFHTFHSVNSSDFENLVTHAALFKLRLLIGHNHNECDVGGIPLIFARKKSLSLSTNKKGKNSAHAQ
jgi:hypothetical protein